LKRKTFILEKFLDTAFRPPIRFFPESSDGFLNLRWNYSPLKEKAVQLPDGLSRYFLLLLQTAQGSSYLNIHSAPEAFGSARKSASPATRLSVATLHTA
jgi:hypothetical protein